MKKNEQKESKFEAFCRKVATAICLVMAVMVLIYGLMPGEKPNHVVIGSAYLNGVQADVNENGVALVGIKFIDDKPVQGMSFEGDVYDAAVDAVADWQSLVDAILEGFEVSKEQKDVLTLYAMRNGKFGFINSKFVEDLKSGRSDVYYMWLYDHEGIPLELKQEGIQYMWVLKNLWLGNVTIDELAECPMLSYRAIPVEQMFDENGNVLWNKELQKALHQGSRKTALEALGL